MYELDFSDRSSSCFQMSKRQPNRILQTMEFWIKWHEKPKNKCSLENSIKYSKEERKYEKQNDKSKAIYAYTDLWWVILHLNLLVKKCSR